MVVSRLSDLPFQKADLLDMPAADRMVMTTPDHFDIQYVINPHMEGHVGSVDPVTRAGSGTSSKMLLNPAAFR